MQTRKFGTLVKVPKGVVIWLHYFLSIFGVCKKQLKLPILWSKSTAIGVKCTTRSPLSYVFDYALVMRRARLILALVERCLGK